MKGINFIEDLFNATIGGRKTQTRRIMKPQPILDEKGNPTADWENIYNKPRYKVGEIVYLKEPYRFTHIDNVWFINYLYNRNKKDFPISAGNRELHKALVQQEKSKSGWCNKLFMPAKYARYFIEITALRYERLQNISDEDCMKEGIRKIGEMYAYNYICNRIHYFKNPQNAYTSMINKISGRRTWESNPYVWVYDYVLTNKKN